MQNRTENSPVIPPVKQGISPENTAGLEGFRSAISKAGLSLPNEIIADEEFIDSLQTVSLLTMLVGTSYSLAVYLQVHSDAGVKTLR